MTEFQLWTFFGTPIAGAMLAWGLVGLHRFLPRPTITHDPMPQSAAPSGQMAAFPASKFGKSRYAGSSRPASIR